MLGLHWHWPVWKSQLLLYAPPGSQSQTLHPSGSDTDRPNCWESNCREIARHSSSKRCQSILKDCEIDEVSENSTKVSTLSQGAKLVHIEFKCQHEDEIYIQQKLSVFDGRELKFCRLGCTPLSGTQTFGLVSKSALNIKQTPCFTNNRV